jgi:hypothetical protein
MGQLLRIGRPRLPRSRRHIPREPPERGDESPRLIKIIPLALVAAAIFAAGVFAYIVFRDISAVPVPPEDPGKIQILFDRPSVPAYLEATITEVPYVSAMELKISIDDAYSQAEVGFTIMITGAARATERFPGGQARPKEIGCWSSIHAIRVSLSCSNSLFSPGGFGDNSTEDDEDTQVLTGVMHRGPDGMIWATILFDLDATFSTTAGKRSYFSLPAVGTPYAPPEWRTRLTFAADEGREGFVPGTLTVAVDYRELSSRERVESVAPELSRAGSLAWAESDASLLSAKGSTVDTLAEDWSQRMLFMLGVFAGVAPSLFLAAIARISNTLRGMRKTHGAVRRPLPRRPGIRKRTERRVGARRGHADGN